MAYTQIGATVSVIGAASPVTTPGINTTNATLLIVTITAASAITGATVTDSNGNTWHARQDEADTSGSGMHTGMWYAFDKAGSALVTGAAHTVTVAGLTFNGVTFSAFSGSLPNHVDPYDSTAGESGADTTSGTTVQPGSINAIQGSLVVTSLGMNANATVSISAPYLITATLAYNPVVNYGAGVAFTFNVPTTNPTWTGSLTTAYVATIASFKAAPNISPTTVYVSDVISLSDAIIYNPFLADQLHLSDAVFISLNYQASISNDQFKFADFEIGQWTGTPPVFSDSETLTDDAQVTLTFTGGTLSFLDASITVILPGDGLSLSDSPGNLFATFIIGDTESLSDSLSLSDGIQSWDGVSKGGMTDNMIYNDNVNLTIGSLQDNYLRRYLGDVGGT